MKRSKALEDLKAIIGTTPTYDALKSWLQSQSGKSINSQKDFLNELLTLIEIHNPEAFLVLEIDVRKIKVAGKMIDVFVNSNWETEIRIGNVNIENIPKSVITKVAIELMKEYLLEGGQNE